MWYVPWLEVGRVTDIASRAFSRSLLRNLTTPMPIAFKEWAVTVRALAEGEQLLTLRKGGIREPNKHFALDHDRFFLPDVQSPAQRLIRDSTSGAVALL